MNQKKLIERLTLIRDKVEAAYGLDAADLFNLIQDTIDELEEEEQA